MARYRRKLPAMLASLLLLASLFGATGAETRVCPEGCSFATIQEAANSAAPNDAIVVQSGVYREALILGRTIVLQGLDTGSGRTLLAPEKGRIVLAAQGIIMHGFDLSGSTGAGDGNGNCTVEVVLPAVIYLNNFAGNGSVCPEATSSWNSSQPINYQFESRVLRSRLGNYWADYAGKDQNRDGIGDEPKVLDDGNVDYYPLMQPAESYSIAGEKEERLELIRARVNEPFKISIPANPTTGFEWNADYDYHLLRLDGQQYEKPATQAMGAGGTSVFVFAPLRPGKTTISFVYKRPWENIAADTRTFHVEIVA